LPPPPSSSATSLELPPSQEEEADQQQQQQQQPHEINADEDGIKQHDDHSVETHTAHLSQPVPIKVKDRWRRFSEKETTSGATATAIDSADSASNHQQQQLELKLLNSPSTPGESDAGGAACSPLDLVSQLKTSGALSLGSSPSSAGGSPRAFKKMLLNKCASEMSYDDKPCAVTVNSCAVVASSSDTAASAAAENANALNMVCHLS